ncbi:hypothetical protein [Microvirga sp. M2]|uniref:hypothetical protein n=1 Tax=Microvirga sp. M2 TaxID=3073270 RepID=UPI0039C33665
MLVLYSKELWNAPSEDQPVACACAELSRDKQRKVSCELSQASLDKIEGSGIIVNELNGQEANRMRDEVKSVWEKHASSIGPGTVTMMPCALETMREQ